MIPWIVSRRKKTQSSKIDDDVQNKSDFIFEIISNVLIEKFLDLLAKVKQNNTQWFHEWHIFSARNSCGTWERDRTKNMTWNRQSFHTDIQDRHFSIYVKTLFNDILRYLCGFFSCCCTVQKPGIISQLNCVELSGEHFIYVNWFSCASAAVSWSREDICWRIGVD